ncbi:RimK family alpha-L-glutamate ligase [Halalkalibacterium halodurans]|uniref:BH2598 protein n=1 Tax=Halalkalibacterium halodurans (strain ATCC BAA-125 / DSM 18197 / FERM 7344 / JCM 9153 / C-125) TaxID=272558 RepID=Q9K9P7_HALH5|nr:RimK family alpha-L-glutamate ligase [Halalkalibacterium halodurans]MDY7223134.1 RimK family alpha-L-glutamate ligase [Halalkalibacterium halodurans]MDY7242355.1 RimK family alpha-L-glutamate ligase [Halalkalibacterium halodurans]MED4079742.1 RimK family alpha-L-glutamate ligase [Halalkalibacterium halodurans]MED4086316.1 RimK family alpha-L-glutamate ligase [Halalkalibacterium halodurans]MED4103339.1 RimK family alpha-L-glutamate ligase [Halalkalibacterium halodurans]
MKFVTFNPFRTIGMANIQYVKPEHMFQEREKIIAADVCLFPENWQVNALVYGMKKPIFPSIQSIQMGHNKIEVTRALWSVCPEHVPFTLILGRNPENIEKVLSTFTFPFVAKEYRSSMGRGVFLIQSAEEFYEYAEQNPYFYVQEYLPIERDLRICVIGDDVVAAYWRQSDHQFKNNVAQGGEIFFNDVPEEAITLVKKVATDLGIDHAGFDIALVNDHFYFLEFNTLFGNQGLHMLDVPIVKRIEAYVKKRYHQES